MTINLKQKLCKHLFYDIIKCNKEDKYYICKCNKCGHMFDKPKAIGEMYMKKGEL